jgi:hypothetical protein
MTETWVARPISTDPAARLPTRGQPSMLYTEWPHSTLDFRSLHPQKEPSFFGSFELGCQAPATVGMDGWPSHLRAQHLRWGRRRGQLHADLSRDGSQGEHDERDQQADRRRAARTDLGATPRARLEAGSDPLIESEPDAPTDRDPDRPQPDGDPRC